MVGWIIDKTLLPSLVLMPVLKTQLLIMAGRYYRYIIYGHDNMFVCAKEGNPLGKSSLVCRASKALYIALASSVYSNHIFFKASTVLYKHACRNRWSPCFLGKIET